MKPPGAHERLYRETERSLGHILKAEPGNKDPDQIIVGSHALPPCVTIQLCEIARVIEQRKPALDPTELR